MEELYKVMDDLLEVEFQMKAGMDILKELEELSGSKVKDLHRPFIDEIVINKNGLSISKTITHELEF